MRLSVDFRELLTTVVKKIVVSTVARAARCDMSLRVVLPCKLDTRSCVTLVKTKNHLPFIVLLGVNHLVYLFFLPTNATIWACA